MSRPWFWLWCLGFWVQIAHGACWHVRVGMLPSLQDTAPLTLAQSLSSVCQNDFSPPHLNELRCEALLAGVPLLGLPKKQRPGRVLPLHPRAASPLPGRCSPRPSAGGCCHPAASASSSSPPPPPPLQAAGR